MSSSPHPFAYRQFRLFWASRLCSTLAQNGMVVVIGWQVYDTARRSLSIEASSMRLGLVGLAQFLPLFALTMVAGWAADHLDRRRIAQCASGLQLVAAAVLAVLSLRPVVPSPALFGVAVALGIARAFSNPATNAIAPNLVPVAVLPRAIATNAIAGRVGGILGPALAGFLYAWKPALPHAVNVVLLASSVIAMGLLQSIPRGVVPGLQTPWRRMVEGLHYVRNNSLVLGAISLDLFAVLLGGATAMLPVYAHDILHIGPACLGHLRAAPAVGAMATALWFSVRPLRNRVGIKMLGAVVVFGIATTAFGLSRWVPLSLACLVLLGAADMFSVFVRQSLIQMSTPDHMRGRVGAVSGLFISASNELGEAESGFLSAAVGPVAAVVAGGIGSIAIALFWARLFPALRQAHQFGEPTGAQITTSAKVPGPKTS
ncbi:MFS transporter [Sphingomonas sp. TF3]|uniref:MFS transporter n=1 Tax=Sphingomonas sp. TF3 TaxID=2495580 RepID=UPI000F883895|nr:MFS transporter [Sphingomonas sp. TF3]RUN77005.1 MFS transporter [Sphingomonas sp. TF3]